MADEQYLVPKRRVSEDEQDVFFRFFPEDHERLRAASAAQIAAHRPPLAS